MIRRLIWMLCLLHLFACSTIESGSKSTLVQPQVKTQSDFFKPVETQYFTLLKGVDSVFVGKQGTRIHLKSNLFTWDNARELKIELQEYYSVSEMLAGKLHTMGEMYLLETGGMINLKSSIPLKNDSEFKIDFPNSLDSNAQMKAFQAEGFENDSLGTWKEYQKKFMSKATYDKREGKSDFIFDDIPQEQASFPGGLIAFRKFLNDSIRYPDILLDSCYKEKVYLKFLISKEGKVSAVKVRKGNIEQLNLEAVRVIESSPDWIPATLEGKPIDSYFSIPIIFSSDCAPDYQQNNSGQSRFPIQKYNTISSITKTEENQIKAAYTALTTNKLGWINCDRFIYEKLSDVSFQFIGRQEIVSVSAIYKSQRSIQSLYTADSKIWNGRLLVEENPTFVLLATVNGKMCYSFITLKDQKAGKLPIWKDFVELQFKQDVDNLWL